MHRTPRWTRTTVRLARDGVLGIDAANDTRYSTQSHTLLKGLA